MGNDAISQIKDKVEDFPDPARTILLLLPETGMRISEICSLQVSHVQEMQGIKGFLFRGKRKKQRFIPLSRRAEELIIEHQKEHNIEEGFLTSFGKRQKSKEFVMILRRSRIINNEELKMIEGYQ